MNQKMKHFRVRKMQKNKIVKKKFIKLSSLWLLLGALFLGCSKKIGNYYNFFPLFDHEYCLNNTELWLVVFNKTQYRHTPLFDTEGRFIQRDGQQVYKLNNKLKKSFYEITSAPSSFEDSSVEVTEELFSFIFVQNKHVVQVVSPDIKGGNMGDYPTMRRESYELSSWSRQGINRLMKFVGKSIKETLQSNNGLPYNSFIEKQRGIEP